MASDEIHVGDIGTVLTVTVQDDTSIVNISGATTNEIWLESPDGTVSKLAADFTTDGTDGKMKYVSLAATFSAPGSWKIQGYVILGAGTWYTDITRFSVFANLDA